MHFHIQQITKHTIIIVAIVFKYASLSLKDSAIMRGGTINLSNFNMQIIDCYNNIIKNNMNKIEEEYFSGKNLKNRGGEIIQK